MHLGALELDTTDTIPALNECIKAYLDSNKDGLMQNPRFTGLFQARRQPVLRGKFVKESSLVEQGPPE